MRKGLVRILYHTIPKPVRDSMAELLGYAELRRRVDGLEERLLESREQLWERSRTRWRQAGPDEGLTWGKIITGDNFIRKVVSYGVFNSESRVLEAGAGYGRLLKSLLGQNVPFKRYVGVDISAACIAYLRKTFESPRISFIQGDFTTCFSQASGLR